MLLDRIDIDAHGPLQRVELGPFSERLNVICGPEGSGKTAITRFIRDSLVQREYPLGMMSSSTGRVVWADQEGMLHCRREKDGSRTGRRTVEFEPRGDFQANFRQLNHSWIEATGALDRERAFHSIQIPESIVDGVITDTAITSVARVVSSCIRGGLDNIDPLQAESPASVHVSSQTNARRRTLRSELAEIEAELAQLNGNHSESELLRRRDELNQRLHDTRVSGATNRGADARLSELRLQLNELENRTGQLRNRQANLRRELAGLDDRLVHFQRDGSHYSALDHQRLEDLDAQIIRWRRTMNDIRGLREAIAPYVRGYAMEYIDLPRREQLRSFINRGPYAYGSPDRRYDGSWYSSDVTVRIDSALRQIDWLLGRYAANDTLADWYRPMSGFSNLENLNLTDSLRVIRRDLAEVRQDTASKSWSLPEFVGPTRHAELHELDQAEQWLSASIRQLLDRRQDLVSTSTKPPINVNSSYDDLQRERARVSSELERVDLDLNDCVSRSAQVRHRIDLLPQARESTDILGSQQRHAIHQEICQIDNRLAASARIKWLRDRRARLIGDLGITRREYLASPLAEESSRWLVRLSAGRLRKISWPYAAFKSASLAHSIHREYQSSGVCIDDRDEATCTATDRALAVLAVRLAAGELLARSGRKVPLVLEIHRELLQVSDLKPSLGDANGNYHTSFVNPDLNGRLNHPITSALQDYTEQGRQVLLLTSSQDIAYQVGRSGGGVFNLYPNRTVHAHRPIWQSQYASERYVGPHPHIHGDQVAPDFRVPGDFRSRDQGSFPETWNRADINRSFDTAWREAYGLYDNPERSSGYPETDWAMPGEDLRDGYYVSNSYTTDQRAVTPAKQRAHVDSGHLVPISTTNRTDAPKTPFYLTVDSPIDQAPSIDAVAAARLRGLKVTHINHLMQRDSCRLADALGLANVDAATIRRWKAECRLVCRVPQLRGFDARVLVGCGVTDPAELASTPPTELLQRVEDFLATKRGRQILLSGTSYELSRITSWIAAARRASEDRIFEYDSESGRVGREVVDGRVVADQDQLYVFDSDRYEYDGNQGQTARRSERGSARRSRNYSSSRSGGSRDARTGDSRSSGSTRRRSSSASSSRSSRSSSRDSHGRRRSGNRDVVRMQRESRDGQVQSRSSSSRSSSSSSEQMTSAVSGELKFYLHRSSPIVDAPSIGSRMAERLNEVGVYTVEELLNCDPANIAEQLGHRRVDADVVLAWQQQATLVCRIPMLRGHDAQLLVAAEVVTAEDVTAFEPQELLSLIDPISRSSEGKRILRGGKLPDLEEVTEWIANAKLNRDLMAA